MKHALRLTVFLVLYTFYTTNAISQTTAAKPALFANYPATISCAKEVLNQLFAVVPGQDASVAGSNNFLFSGKLVSKTEKYGVLQTVVIRSAQFADAIFVLSRTTSNENGSLYTGRIINTKYADGFELKKDESGNYQLVKFETGQLLPDCKQ